MNKIRKRTKGHRVSKGTVRHKGPPKARRKRARRKAALAKHLSPLVRIPDYETASRVRGGRDLCNVESSTLGGSRACSEECRRKVDTMVLWEYWSGGYWRKASRHKCEKHARKLAKKLGKAA